MNQGRPAAGRECWESASGRKRSAATSTRLRMYRRTSSGWQFTVGASWIHAFRFWRIAGPSGVANLGLCTVSPVTGVTLNLAFHVDLGCRVKRYVTDLESMSVSFALEEMMVSRMKSPRL